MSRLSARSVLLVPAAIVAMLVPQAGSAHQLPVHPYPISKSGGRNDPRQVTYVDVYRHSDFTLNVEVTFSWIGDNCGYIRYVEFYYYNIGTAYPFGGRLWMWAGSDSVRYDADIGRAFPPGRTYRTHQDVNREFCHGQQQNKRLAVTTQKSNSDYFEQADAHWSTTTWYRP
jgi:hypothetical protein